MTKSKSIRVRLTEAEWSQAETASLSLFGAINKSRLIRKLLRDYVGLGPDLSDKEINEFREAVRQLTGMARNLNQITARIQVDETQKKQLTENYLERLKLQVFEVNECLKNYIHRTVTRYQETVNHDH